MWLLVTVVLAAPTNEQVGQAIAAYNGGAVHALPVLSADQQAKLVGGDCVRVMAPNADPDGPSTAVGMLLTSVSRDALWLAAQDPHAQVDPDLTEFIVEEQGADSALWYGYWDLPKPIQDRQWVVRSWNNHALATQTGNASWEHAWALVPDGLDQVRGMVAAGRSRGVDEAMVSHAIFTPVNEGSWSMVTVGDQTLLAYQASSVVGGSVPDWLVARLVMARLESVLRGVEDRARQWAPGHYTAGHGPVHGGDGRSIAVMSSPM